ncbi:MAG: ApaG domain [Blastochloris sp.]|nr:ApaG domain [Blastochloris sp.]
MPESSRYQEISGLWVNVDRVEHVPSMENPADRPYRFGYDITIHNDSLRIVTILGRKWIVTNAKGHKLIVEADGVIGKFPHLKPGDQFHYNNYHLIDSDSSAEGFYHGKDEEGQSFIVRIPLFTMQVCI